MKKLKRNLLSNVVFTILLIFLLVVPVGCDRIEEPIQTSIIANDRFIREANLIVDRLKLRTGAKATALAIYSVDLTYRVVIVSSGELPEMGKEAASNSLPGYREILEVVNSGETFYSTVEDLPEGLLKSDLVNSNITVLAASPIYESKGYLIGFVSVAVPEGSVVDKDRLVSYTEQASAELSRLSGVLH